MRYSVPWDSVSPVLLCISPPMRNGITDRSIFAGILNWLFALPAIYTIDTFGRRFLLLLTFPFLALFQLLTAMAFLLPDKSKGQTALALTGMYLFSICYSPGEGPVPFVYSAESMPLYVRDLGMSMATATLWVFNFFLAVTFPKFRVALTNTGAFGWYAAWCVIGWFMILLFVPETKGLTLEALDARFSISTRSHARWAISDVYWAFRYYVLRRKVKRPVLCVSKNESGVQMREIIRREVPMDGRQRGFSGVSNEA